LIFHSGQGYYSVKSQYLSYSTGPEAEAGFIKRFGPHRVLFRTHLSHFRFAKPSDQGGVGMEQKGFHRKLTAILSADVAGYSRLMQDDEAVTVRTLEAYKRIISDLVTQHRGRVVDSPGDNLLAEFASVVDAVQCAVAVQKELQARNTELPENRKMQFRIGVNLGDVIEEGERIYGDGVNVAARLESLAEPGGICVSKTAFDQIETKLPFGYHYLGEQKVKNIAKPVGAYKVLLEPRVTTMEDLDAKQPGTRTTRTRKIAFGCTAALLIAIGATAVWQFTLHKFQPPPEKVDLRKVAFAPPDKTSIAVLPFQNMTGDPQQEYLSDGMAEQLIMGLSQSPDIYVTARTSSFAYKGKSMAAQQIADQLGVRYLLEGSVQRDADQVRINVQLIDGRNGNHIWADRFDRKYEDLFVLQDQITMAVMEALNAKFTVGVSATNLSTSLKLYRPSSLKAYECYLKGVYHHLRRTKQDIFLARQMFEEAINLDPNFGAAHNGLAHVRMDEIWFGTTTSPEKSIEQAEQAVQKVIALNPDQPPPYSTLSQISLLKKDFDKAILNGEKAVELNPNDAGCYFSLGMVLRSVGRYEEAIQNLEIALRLSPLRPLPYANNLAWSCLGTKQYDKAILLWSETLERNPDYLFAYLGLTAAYELSGNHEKACWAAVNVMRVNPKFSIAVEEKMSPIKDEASKKRYFDVLRSAGLK
jgi:adenylate cyclase